MSTTYRRTVPLLGALGLCMAMGACKEEPPTPKLFDETGVWSVISYDLEGTGQVEDILNSNRADAFMLKFEPPERVVMAASCIEPGSETPANSPCLISPSTTEWECRCFAYDFVREEMLWREFAPGDIPPEVSLSDSTMSMGDGGGSGGSGDGGGEPSDDVLVNVAAIEDVNSTFNFRPLPLGVFGSNGTDSRYIMQARANSVFDNVTEDPDRPTCTPCI